MANNNVDVGDHGGAPFSPNGSQSASSPGTSGERKAGRSARRQSSPVNSYKESADLRTRGQRSQTVSAVMPVPKTSSRQPQRTNSRKKQQASMVYRSGPKTQQSYDMDQILRSMPPRGWEMADGYLQALDLPPITPESLAELDMPRIINNPKLRHDVNFDRELHFRPNLDGSRGRLKIESAELYWKALEGELMLCGYVQAKKYDADYAGRESYWEEMLAASLRRLPKVFKAVGDILKTLVPDSDQQAISDRLDVALIMREISHGVCDLVDLANWLSKVLKSHCAPMRDELVDRMQKEITRGATEQKPLKLVNGLRQLLNILEAMKLDVANHQIRHMRSILVDNSVEFSKRYSAHRVRQGKIDVLQGKRWIEHWRGTLQLASGDVDTTPSYLEAISMGLVKALLFPDFVLMYPPTFYLDVERLRTLRQDMQANISIQICKDVLLDFCAQRSSPQTRAQALNTLHASISAIVGPLGQFEANKDNIAAEIMRIGLMLEGTPDITYDAVLLDAIDERLDAELHFGSTAYFRSAEAMSARLVPKLFASLERDVKLSAVQIQDKHVPIANGQTASHPLAYGAVCAPTMRALPSDPDDDFIRRFSHILALHWQAWAELCYLVPFEDLEAAVPEEGSEPPPSPTVPVAQAVYAPGHKWLPVGLTVKEVPSGLPTPAPTPRPQSSGQAKAEQAEKGDTSAFDQKTQPQPFA